VYENVVQNVKRINCLQSVIELDKCFVSYDILQCCLPLFVTALNL